MSLEKLFKENSRDLKSNEEIISKIEDISFKLDEIIENREDLSKFMSKYIQFIETYKIARERLSKTRLGEDYYQMIPFLKKQELKSCEYDKYLNQNNYVSYLSPIILDYKPKKRLDEIFL